MPDYGGGSSGKGPSLKNKYGSGNAASKARSKASERRKKNAIQAAQRAAKALADQKKIDAAKAASTQAANQQKANATAQIRAAEQAAAKAAAAARESNVGYGAPPPRQAPEIDPRVIASQQAAARQEQARFAAQQSAQQAAAQRAAAAQAAANQQKSNAIAQIRAAEQAAAAANRNRTSASTAAANQQAAQSLLGAGYRNVKGDKNKSTIFQQIMSGIRNTLGGEGLPGDNPLTAKPVTTDGPSTRLPPPQRDPEVDPFRPPPDIGDPFRPPVYPPVMPPQFPQYPGYGGGMMGGIGAFGYNPALMAFESQQGAGQVPYYMAAARNAQTPNMSPAFMHAARNYDILGGSQRTAPRPMEMMSAAERAQIAGMSNFSTPNYNSPYDQFNFFSNMVGGGGGGGKGMGRPAPQMAGGLGAFYGGFA
jgi:hypothetical protein